MTRQSDQFSARKREFAPCTKRHPGSFFVGAAICLFFFLLDFHVPILVVCRALSFFFLAGKAVFGAAEVRCLTFAWMKISLHGQMRGLPLTVRQIKVLPPCHPRRSRFGLLRSAKILKLGHVFT